MDERMAHWELVVITYKGIEAYDVYILNSFAFLGLIV